MRVKQCRPRGDADQADELFAVLPVGGEERRREGNAAIEQEGAGHEVAAVDSA
jgi:hypothetical protein